MRPRTARLAAATFALVLSMSAVARPYTVEDLLRTEGFGTVAFDPHGRWLVFERLEPFLAMSRFDMLARSAILRSRLYRVDLRGPWQAKPLSADPHPGTIVYGFSPGGSRLAIGRLSGEQWQLGVVTMATGATRWFDLSPDYSPFYPTLRWLSDDRLVVLAMPEGQRPLWLLADSLPADRLPVRWAATRSGRAPAVTAIGSGRFGTVNAMPVKKRLLSLDAVTGEVDNLASEPFLSMSVAPGGRRLALTETGTTAPLPQGRSASLIDGPSRQTIAIFDLDRNMLWRPCADCDVFGSPSWSADGRNLAFLARRGAEDWLKATMFAVDTRMRSILRFDRGDVVPLIADDADGGANVAFGWSRNQLLFYGRSARTTSRQRDWYVLQADRPAKARTSALDVVTSALAPTKDCRAAMTTPAGIWCLDRESPRKLTDRGTVDQDGAITGWQRHLGLLSIRIGNARRDVAVNPTDRVERVAISAANGLFVVQTTTDQGVRTMRLVTRDRDEPIATGNLHLREVQPARAQPLSSRLPDGRQVTHWLYLPAVSRPADRLPLVVIPYPEQQYGVEQPAGQRAGAARFEASAQILAGHGYAVLLPSLPADMSRNDTTSGLVETVDSAVDAAISTGNIDPRRLVLWGHSYGAYAVAMIVSRTDRYAAAIAGAGIYDLGSTVGIFGPTMRLAPEFGIPIGTQYAWAETGQGRMKALPWRDPRGYVERSPTYRTDRINTPMLIIGADRDVSPLSQAEQLFSSLFRQNKDAELLTYWGEGHVVGSPANVRDLYGRIFDWLDIIWARPCPGASGQVKPVSCDPATRAPNAP